MYTDSEKPTQTSDDSHVFCWGCQTHLAIPSADGVQAPIFKCGWCGAISQLDSSGKRRREAHPFDKLRSVLPALRAAFVGFVVLLLFSVPFFGFIFLLPNLFSGLPLALHLTWSLLLAANTYFNFAAAVLRPPGPVEFEMPQTNTPVGKGAFDNCMFCTHCRQVKPPQAHHCSRCTTCVMDMDHHCLFLNNCVGRGNIRHFILLLVFLFWSCTYTFLLCCALHWRRWDEAAMTWQRLLLPIAKSKRYWEAILVTPRFLLVAPAWQAAVTYLMSLTGGSCVGVTILLASQLRLIVRGQTYIESLAAAPSHGGDWQASLRRIFGSEHPIKWFTMRWYPPPGAVQAKKGD
ncbi:zf-DHHC-domain-containing protein [Coccomyxa subellipsoidea C-169]|uniref:S-acyltransferase n=1 Tax=Coccomyxa subellipsoidea (strain C-169) TaxID=574566 RepID=I0Z1X8_COCSC|nr:zf-DHHC-domain-containing protein [Coccomyxa subellipsoidea C-169]EIE24647.1 zf-DHHC-domain-containing protein [Coccomyxa subellipsoidea C-169]|eukprot:XP_005649191.1 zf-DHHC-domain-containing protein [Coccomyxa subellipsoidea C-169]